MITTCEICNLTLLQRYMEQHLTKKHKNNLEKEYCPICYEHIKCDITCKCCRNKWCKNCDKNFITRKCPMCRTILP